MAVVMLASITGEGAAILGHTNPIVWSCITNLYNKIKDRLALNEMPCYLRQRARA